MTVKYNVRDKIYSDHFYSKTINFASESLQNNNNNNNNNNNKNNDDDDNSSSNNNNNNNNDDAKPSGSVEVITYLKFFNL